MWDTLYSRSLKLRRQPIQPISISKWLTLVCSERSQVTWDMIKWLIAIGNNLRVVAIPQLWIWHHQTKTSNRSEHFLHPSASALNHVGSSSLKSVGCCLRVHNNFWRLRPSKLISCSSVQFFNDKLCDVAHQKVQLGEAWYCAQKKKYFSRQMLS